MNFGGMSQGEWALVIFILGLVFGAHAVPRAFGWLAGVLATSKKG